MMLLFGERSFTFGAPYKLKEEMNFLSIAMVGLAVQFYFQITGQEGMKATITAVDEATGEVLNTGMYPQEE